MRMIHEWVRCCPLESCDIHKIHIPKWGCLLYYCGHLCYKMFVTKTHITKTLQPLLIKCWSFSNPVSYIILWEEAFLNILFRVTSQHKRVTKVDRFCVNCCHVVSIIIIAYMLVIKILWNIATIINQSCLDQKLLCIILWNSRIKYDQNVKSLQHYIGKLNYHEQ